MVRIIVFYFYFLFCPKEWRLRLINSCTDELTGMVHTAIWGSADLRRAGKVMTRAGTGGAGILDHVNLRKEGQIARATSSYEVGGRIDTHQITKDGLM